MNCFDSFLTSYLQDDNRRDGLSVFGLSPAQMDALLARCQEQNVPTQIVVASKFNPESFQIAEENHLLIIQQDLGVDLLDYKVRWLVDHLIYPLWFRRRRFLFLSQMSRENYGATSVAPADIHPNLDGVYAWLIRLQLVDLLGETTTLFDTFDALENGSLTALTKATQRRKRRTPFAIDSNLDGNQRRAQRLVDGPIRVLAPAGSGKTKTLTNRIVHLLNEGVAPNRILALAFNRKAAREMKARLRTIGVTSVDIRTFHSLGYRILRQKLPWSFDTQQEERLKRQLLQQALPDDVVIVPQRDNDPLEPFLDALQRAKNDLTDLDSMTVEMEEDDVPFGPIFERFLELQRKNQLLTFDDMIYLALRVLLRDDRMRQLYQSQFHYVLVDEFQDLNQAQMLLLSILALPQNNLFVVGDDDQMIYGWRGATVEHILDFEQRYPVASSIILRTNYRSGQAIVDHSRQLINYNRRRVAKNVTARQGAPAGSVHFTLHESLWLQAQAAAAWIQQQQAEQRDSFNQYAILHRFRAYQYPLALALDALDIPHVSVDLGELFTTAVGRDIYAYLHTIINPAEADAEQLQRILKRPNKYFTNRFVESIGDWSDIATRKKKGSLKPWAWERLQEFTVQIEALHREASRLSATELLFRLNLEMDLIGYYDGDMSNGTEVDGDTDEVLLQTIFALAGYFEKPRAFYAYLNELRQPAEPAPQQQNDNNGVILSTIHQSKGKEFTSVVYYNLSADAHSNEDEQIEEERRVAYVAATRAQEALYITAQKGNVSPFLRELLTERRFSRLNSARLIQERNRLRQQIKRMEKKWDQKSPEELIELEAALAEKQAELGRYQRELSVRRELDKR